jgi:hypothetical protein
MSPRWTLRTARLVLTPVNGVDLPDLIRIKGDPRVFAVMLRGVRSVTQTHEELARDVIAWGAEGFGIWTIREAGSGGFVGITGLERRPDGRGVALRPRGSRTGAHHRGGAREQYRLAYGAGRHRNAGMFQLRAKRLGDGGIRKRPRRGPASSWHGARRPVSRATSARPSRRGGLLVAPCNAEDDSPPRIERVPGSGSSGETTFGARSCGGRRIRAPCRGNAPAAERAGGWISVWGGSGGSRESERDFDVVRLRIRAVGACRRTPACATGRIDAFTQDSCHAAAYRKPPGDAPDPALLHPIALAPGCAAMFGLPDSGAWPTC